MHVLSIYMATLIVYRNTADHEKQEAKPSNDPCRDKDACTYCYYEHESGVEVKFNN